MNYLQSALTVVLTLAIGIGAYLFVPLSMWDALNSLVHAPRFGSAITVINGSDTLSNSRPVINANFANLNADKFELSAWYATTSAPQIVTLGTITTGTWSGSTITVAKGGTGLTTFGGTNHLLYTTAADTLSSESALTYSASLDLLTFLNGTSTNLSVASWLGIPNSTNPAITAAGTLAINTTAASSSLRFYDGTAERVLNVTYDKTTGPVASTTLSYIGLYSATGTTSLHYWNPEHPFTVLAMRCKTNANTAFVQVSDGTNLGTLVPCTTSGVRTAIVTNGSFVMNEDFKINFGSHSATSPNTITVSLTLRDDAD